MHRVVEDTEPPPNHCMQLEVVVAKRKTFREKLVQINELRDFLARRHGATIACPIVTGIEARIVAGAAGEDEADGKKRVVPYWRTLKSKGELNEKYPGGVEDQRRRLEGEGFTVVPRGKRFYVSEFEKRLARLS